jgi:transposase
MLIATYEAHGSKIIYEPPQVTPEFLLRLTLWAIKHDASYVQVARKFGYTNISSIWKWNKIYI